MDGDGAVAWERLPGWGVQGQGQQEAGDPFHRQVGDGLISNPKPAVPELFRIMHAIAEFLGGEAAELQADAHTPVVPR